MLNKFTGERKDEPFWSKPKEDDNINYSLNERVEIEKEGKNNRERMLNRTTLRALNLCASKIDQRINYSCGCGFV